MRSAILLLILGLTAAAPPEVGEVVIRTDATGALVSDGAQGTIRNERRAQLPVRSDAYERARSVLPRAFRSHESARYVLLTDTPVDTATAQVERLERAAHQYARFARALGFEPEPIRHKLVCILFADRAAYRRFAVRHDQVADPWIAGYYSPSNDRVVFYQGDANPSLVAARAKLDEMAADVETIGREAREAAGRGESAEASELASRHDRYRAHVATEESRLAAFRRQVIVATTTHEAIHQLAFHTGLQSTRVQSPLWLSEGLATSFETEHEHAAFGPSHEFSVRREAFSELLEERDVVPLEELVVCTDLGNRAERYIHRFYHSSYALFAYFWRTDREALGAYFAAVRNEPAGRLKTARARELFVAHFGPIREVERRWIRWERSR